VNDRGGKEPVSVLGLGPMGQALARAFLTAGHPTIVWNRTAARAVTLTELGATRADDAVDAIRAGSLVIACLVDDSAVGEVLQPLAGQLRGRALVNLTSSSPRQSRERSAWAARHGIDYLDGAILTPTPTIGQPSALILYSGPPSAYQAAQPVLAALGGRAVYLGADPGRAAAYDVSCLAMFWLSVLGIAHGLALASAEGIPGSDLGPYAQAIAGMLPEMTTRFATQLAAGDYPGDRSTITSAAAGLGHITQTAREHALDAVVLDASMILLGRAVQAGHGANGLARLAETLATANPRQ
jgi:3-hydroxyisobutyrate dehydrogenase-like beta-hydroxyacid dehydrogenase